MIQQNFKDHQQIKSIHRRRTLYKIITNTTENLVLREIVYWCYLLVVVRQWRRGSTYLVTHALIGV